jgi:pimeloyl-ACP methyl ester carboxylesterase
MGKRKILRAKGRRQGVPTTRLVVPREATVATRRLFYGEAGMGAPLILIHGLGGSARWWFSMFPELTSAHFRVLAPDLPGFGRSPGPMLKIPEAARAVVDLADHLGLARFFLCGHSMGGAVAAQVAAEFGGRVRRLVLIDSAGIRSGTHARWLGRLAQPWSWCPPWFYRTFLGDLLRAGPGNMLEGMRQLGRYDIRPVLERVKAPSLVIWGEKDSLTPLAHGRRIVEGLNDARLELVAGARHLPMVSHPDTVSRLVVSFLKEDANMKS